MAIVVATGTGRLSQLAVERAVAEARLRDLPIVLVGQIAMPRNEPASAAYQRQRAQLEVTLQARADDLAEHHGVRCTPYLPPIPASPGDAVLRAADEFDADLIVVGIPRRSPVGKTVLGSDSQHIILEADCTVIGVKLPEGEEDRPS